MIFKRCQQRTKLLLRLSDCEPQIYFKQHPLPAKKRWKLQLKYVLPNLLHLIGILTRAQRRILNYLIFMSQRVRSLYMSQTHIGDVVGVKREWVCKCIALLRDLGLITSDWRKPQRPNQWRTNIYSVTPLFLRPQVAYEVSHLLSSLRGLSKQFTQLESENIYIRELTTQKREKENMNEQVKDPPIKKDTVMDMTLQEIMELARRAPKTVPQPTKQNSVRRFSNWRNLNGETI